MFTEIIWSLLQKMNVPVDEARNAIEQLEDGGMGYLFENAEKMDIQAERQNTKEQKERADIAEKRADSAEKRADTAEKRADSAEKRADSAEKESQNMKLVLDRFIEDLILRKRSEGCTKEEVQKALQEEYGLKSDDAYNIIEKQWK